MSFADLTNVIMKCFLVVLNHIWTFSICNEMSQCTPNCNSNEKDKEEWFINNNKIMNVTTYIVYYMYRFDIIEVKWNLKWSEFELCDFIMDN